MTYHDQDIVQLLREIGIEKDKDEVTIRDVNAAFRKQVKKIHSDKAGGEKTAICQELVALYKKLKEIFKEKDDPKDKEISDDDDSEEKFFRDNFEMFNFPNENKGSFTVGIEDDLADIWQHCLQDLLGKPKVNINDKGTECDRSWKFPYKSVELTLHIYNNPKNKKGSKIMIQGKGQSLLFSYVFEELPKIYKDVCERKPKRLEHNKKKERTGVKCEQCKYTSSLIQMKMHMKRVHAPSKKRILKRLPNFTPRVEEPKKLRHDGMNIMMNAEGVMEDDSILLLDDTFSGKDNVETLNKAIEYSKPVENVNNKVIKVITNDQNAHDDIPRTPPQTIKHVTTIAPNVKDILRQKTC